MEILSISIDKKTMEKLTDTQNLLGFKSRSKLLRTAIMNIMDEYKELNTASGNIECIFVITYLEKERNHTLDIIHKFQNVIKTEIHHHSYGMGVEIIIINSDAKIAKDMFSTLKKNKCVYSVKYTLLGKNNQK
ncbi:MAG: hypothetical protein QXD23_01745 [Candidatus Micrarchaeaceae archaeon]